MTTPKPTSSEKQRALERCRAFLGVEPAESLTANEARVLLAQHDDLEVAKGKEKQIRDKANAAHGLMVNVPGYECADEVFRTLAAIAHEPWPEMTTGYAVATKETGDEKMGLEETCAGAKHHDAKVFANGRCDVCGSDKLRQLMPADPSPPASEPGDPVPAVLDAISLLLDGRITRRPMRHLAAHARAVEALSVITSERAAHAAEVERLKVEHDSWRRVAERLQRELTEARKPRPLPDDETLALRIAHTVGTVPEDWGFESLSNEGRAYWLSLARAARKALLQAPPVESASSKLPERNRLAHALSAAAGPLELTFDWFLRLADAAIAFARTEQAPSPPVEPDNTPPDPLPRVLVAGSRYWRETCGDLALSPNGSSYADPDGSCVFVDEVDWAHYRSQQSKETEHGECNEHSNRGTETRDYRPGQPRPDASPAGADEHDQGTAKRPEEPRAQSRDHEARGGVPLGGAGAGNGPVDQPSGSPGRTVRDVGASQSAGLSPAEAAQPGDARLSDQKLRSWDELAAEQAKQGPVSVAMFEELKKQVGGLADAWAVERGFAIANEQRRKLSARIDAIEARVAKLEVDGRVAKRMVVGRMQHTQSDRAAWDAIEAEERASATAATKSG